MNTMTYVINVNDVDGDLVDHLHLCSAACQSQKLAALGFEPDTGAGEQKAADGTSVDYGAWPGGCETDYDEYCEFCGDFLWAGLESETEPEPTYRVVRRYFDSVRWGWETIATGLTLAEAQAHCQDPQTSSKTATSPEGVQRTAERGDWFDGYEEEK